MTTQTRVVEVEREIDATPDAVFHALTHPLDLSFWLCHHAWAEPHVGGELLLRWRNGWWARGVFQMVERPRRVAVTWQGKDEPGETELVFELLALDRGTAVKLRHGGYGSDAVWDKAVAEAESSWPLALENLGSILTTGIDLRQANAPVLGIIPEELAAERAARQGLGIARGIYLAGVLEGGGAARAGLQKGDVIISIGGFAVLDLNSLSSTLSSYRAGDRVQVQYIRGRAQATASAQLASRSMPDIPADPSEVVRSAREMHASLASDLRQLLVGVTEAQAAQKPSGGEWSVNEVLAHLSVNERLVQSWLCDTSVGTTQGQSGGNCAALPGMLAMTLAVAPTVEALLQRWEHDTAETLLLFSTLGPQVSAAKARYRSMASRLLSDLHLREHVHQIKEILAVTSTAIG